MKVGTYPVCFLCDRAMHLNEPIKLRGYPKFWNVPKEIVIEAEGKLRQAELVDPSFRWAHVHKTGSEK